MKMSATDLQLLTRYVRHDSEEAFAEVVRRHLNLVFSAALRQVHSPQLAEEVAQTVFRDLALQAKKLTPGTILTAWLYQVTRRTAIDVVRSETRRQLREQVAIEVNAMNATASDWTEIAPLLDEAMHALDDADRTAVLLRYFENKTLREVGQTLDTTEEAARKRISRAIDRLHGFFAKRGVTIGASGLAVLISANAVQAAPVGLAAVVSGAAVLAAVHTKTVIAATKSITMTTLQKTLTTVTVVAALGTGIYEALKASTLHRQNQLLQQPEAALNQEIQQARHERDDAASKLAALRDDTEAQNRNTSELLKLRGEVGRLKRELVEATAARNQAESQTAPSSVPNDALERQKRMARVKGMDAFLYVSAFLDYAKANQGQLPTNWTQVASYLTNNPNGTPSGTNEFELLYDAPLNWNDLGTNMGRTILFREYLAWPTIDGKWGKVYGFANGSSEIHYESDGDFTSWEKQFVIPNAHDDK